MKIKEALLILPENPSYPIHPEIKREMLKGKMIESAGKGKYKLTIHGSFLRTNIVDGFEDWTECFCLDCKLKAL